MESFHCIKRESIILAVIGLIICFLLSSVFMLVGFYELGEKGHLSIEVIFGLAGLGLFIIFMRGAWMLVSGIHTHVFSIDRNQVVWGYVGKEKTLDMAQVRHIYWDDTDGFTLNMTTHEGELIRFIYAETVISINSRWKLLRFFNTTFPEIPIDGHIDSKTKEAAA